MLQHTKIETKIILDLGGYMQEKYLTLEDAEKLANYNKISEQRNYWKSEYDVLKIKYEKLVKENKSLKKIIAEVNRGNNEK